MKFGGGADAPCELSFHKGDRQLAASLVERLTHVCGPLALIQANDAEPAVVCPGCDPVAVAARLTSNQR